MTQILHFYLSVEFHRRNPWRAHTVALTSAGIMIPGPTTLSFAPAQRASLLAGCVCRMSGEVAITPERMDTVSFEG